MMLTALVMLALQAASPPNVHKQVPATIDTVIIARDTMSQIEEPRQDVVLSADVWETLWRRHSGTTPAPKVDFSTRSVIAIFLGTRPTAGYAVDITGARESGGILTVEWRERTPDPGAITAQVLTSPMVIASIPKFAGEIRFAKADK